MRSNVEKFVSNMVEQHKPGWCLTKCAEINFVRPCSTMFSLLWYISVCTYVTYFIKVEPIQLQIRQTWSKRSNCVKIGQTVLNSVVVKQTEFWWWCSTTSNTSLCPFDHVRSCWTQFDMVLVQPDYIWLIMSKKLNAAKVSIRGC